MWYWSASQGLGPFFPEYPRALYKPALKSKHLASCPFSRSQAFKEAMPRGGMIPHARHWMSAVFINNHETKSGRKNQRTVHPWIFDIVRGRISGRADRRLSVAQEALQYELVYEAGSTLLGRCREPGGHEVETGGNKARGRIATATGMAGSVGENGGKKRAVLARPVIPAGRRTFAGCLPE